MTHESDEELARLLQEQFDIESAERIARSPALESGTPINSRHDGGGDDDDMVYNGARPVSIVDERWEFIDPNPDIRALFLQFNDRFFWGKLAGIEVKWSPRMTLCAGLCCYEGRGGLCSIRLSLPLLKLRPRKDLVETLLHEMIHALLFVTHNNKDHDSHGPEFHKHMYRINKDSGTNISVYHNFHDEVNVYRQHWWKCSGPCQKRPPYFGILRRAMNRAPSPRDPWWGEHQRTCGGTYTKIKEPEGYGQKKVKNKKTATDADTQGQKKADGADIRELFSRQSQPAGGSEAATVENSETNCSASSSSGTSGQSVATFSGTGHVLGGSSSGRSRLLGDENAPPSNREKSNSKPNLKAKKPRPSPITCFSSSSDEEYVVAKKPKIRKIETASSADETRPEVEDRDSEERGHSLSKVIKQKARGSREKGNSSSTVSNAFTNQTPNPSPSLPASILDPHGDRDDNDLVPTSVSLTPSAALDSASGGASQNSNSGTGKMVNCPVCSRMVVESDINTHLDSCLNSQM